MSVLIFIIAQTWIKTQCICLPVILSFFFLFLIAIEGLPFEVNSKFEMLWKKSGVG